MDELIKKYHAGTLTPEELSQLRQLTDSASDEELVRALTATPLHDAPDPASIPESSLQRMKRNIDTATTTVSPWWRQAVAAVIIALVACAGTWLYIHYNSNPHFSNMTVSTGHGQTTDITLPDGTSVILGNCTRLEYMVENDTRTVNFSGEAYFKVARATDNIPAQFAINTPGMKVEVSGTEFSLTARDQATMASLTLDSGKVRLTADASAATVELTPGQIATLDMASGRFTVAQAPVAGYDLPWLRHEIVLLHASADKVAEALYNAYGVELPTAALQAIDSPFTGTLPADDLPAALTILGHLYAF